jgi:hypothetical protein
MQNRVVENELGRMGGGEGDRLLFLLKHEFRLWNRSPLRLSTFWKSLRVCLRSIRQSD